MSKTETQSEREMLEAAAKHVGISGDYEDGKIWCLNFIGNLVAWDPRGQGHCSQELQAVCRISVEHNDPHDRHPWVCASVWTDGDSSEQQYLEDVPDESQRADRMRLAILRCAAAQAPKEQA
ncbi:MULTISPECIES: hypothetical protein [Delftia]|uniref:hypothetical protein n=1 Tax=Delftia TaxID=80865 RepID=UPI000F83435C|nr:MULTISPECIES: hypothetical protein [Delftia]WEM00081.1 hypothetical protein PW274_07285 [Delftia tsuruhatensis]